eukprot:scaffold26088_cov59-Phaeocystis_antarctica.AAC.3
MAGMAIQQATNCPRTLKRCQTNQGNHGQALGSSKRERQRLLLGLGHLSRRGGGEETGTRDAWLRAEQQVLHLAGRQSGEEGDGGGLGGRDSAGTLLLARAEDVGDQLLDLSSAQVRVLDALVLALPLELERCRLQLAPAAGRLHLLPLLLYLALLQTGDRGLGDHGCVERLGAHSEPHRAHAGVLLQHGVLLLSRAWWRDERLLLRLRRWHGEHAAVEPQGLHRLDVRCLPSAHLGDGSSPRAALAVIAHAPMRDRLLQGDGVEAELPDGADDLLGSEGVAEGALLVRVTMRAIDDAAEVTEVELDRHGGVEVRCCDALGDDVLGDLVAARLIDAEEVVADLVARRAVGQAWPEDEPRGPHALAPGEAAVSQAVGPGVKLDEDGPLEHVASLVKLPVVGHVRVRGDDLVLDPLLEAAALHATFLVEDEGGLHDDLMCVTPRAVDARHAEGPLRVDACSWCILGGALLQRLGVAG